MQRRPLVLVSGKDPLAKGGHESYVRAHAMAAAKLGFEPHVFCVGRRPEVVEEPFGFVHRVLAPPRRQPPALLQVPLPVHTPFLARGIASFLAPRGGGPRSNATPELIHGFGFSAAAGVAASRILARAGVDAIPIASAYATRVYEITSMQSGLHAHHRPMHRVRYRAWLRWVRAIDHRIEGWGYGQSRAVLVNYDSVRRLLLGAYGPELELRRIPYCAPEAFEPRSRVSAAPEPLRGLRPANAPLILAVSRQEPRKGIDVLLLALARLREQGVAFRACLVGPGKLLSDHRRLASRMGLDGHVIQPGEVPEVGPYWECADVFVLPSLAESSGSVSVIEALASGLAVVASACDGIPEDLTDGSDALLVAPGDVAALAAALRRLLTDRPLRERLAAGGRRTHEQRFSAEAFVAALGETYAELGTGAATRSVLARTAAAT